MKRSELTKIVSAAAASVGYNPAEQITTAGLRHPGLYPLALLTSATLKSVDGRNRGVMCYHLKLKLLRLCTQALAEETDELLEQMQQDALAIADALRGNTAVCDVTGFKCSAATEPVSAARHAGLNAEMDIHAYFNTCAE